MAKFLTGGDGTTVGASGNFYVTGGTGIANQTATEADAQATHRTAGTYSNLYARVISNSALGVSLTTRVNTADGNQTLSIGTGTGEFEDTSNTDSISAGDVFDVRLTHGNASNVSYGPVNLLFEASGSTTVRYVSSRPTGRPYSTASTTFVESINQNPAGGTIETAAQTKYLISGTWKNLLVRVFTNSRTTTTNFRNAINGSNGSMLCAFGSGVTGEIEDTSNTDSVVSGDLINYRVITGTGTQQIWTSIISSEITNTDTKAHYNQWWGNTTVAANVTRYLNIIGTSQARTTESDAKLESNIAATISNFACYVQTNGVTATTTLRVRVNGGNGNETIAIGSGATGYFEDSSNTDSVVATDEINFSMVTGATGTNIAIYLWTTLWTVSSNVVVPGNTTQFLMLLGVGT